MKNTILFNIANINFLIELLQPYSDLDKIYKKKLKKYIYARYYPFLINNDNFLNLKNFIKIQLKSDSEINFIRKKNNLYFFFYHEFNKQILVPYHIGTNYFDLLIKLILIKNLKNGFLIHSSSVLINNRAYIFLGKSGSGKSTIVTFLKRISKVFSDDLSLIKKDQDNQMYIFPNPFDKRIIIPRTNMKYPIMFFFFIKKSPKTEIKKIDSLEDFVSNFLPQISLYKRANKIFNIPFNCLNQIYINSYYFYFKKDSKDTESYFKSFLKKKQLL